VLTSMPTAAGAAAPETARPVLWTRDFGLICLFTLTIFTSFQMLMPTIPVYVDRMGATPLVVGLINGIFTSAALAVRPWTGLGLDRNGRRGLWLVGMAIFVLAVFGYVWAVTVPLLMALRVIHGGGWGMVTTASQAAVADIVPPARRGEGMGYFGLGANLGMAVGPATGFFIANHYGFTTLFLACGLLSVIALLLAGAVRLPRVAPAGGGLRPALFERSALGPSLVLFFVTFTYGGVITFIALHAAGHGITNAGWYFTAFALTVVAVRPLCGMVYDRRGHRVVMIPGLLSTALGAVVLALATDLTGFLAAAVLGGFGLGATHPTLQALAFARCPPNRRGAASASFATAFDLGVGSGAVLLGVFSQFLAYSGMYLVAAGAALAGLLAYLASVGRGQKAEPPGMEEVRGRKSESGPEVENR